MNHSSSKSRLLLATIAILALPPAVASAQFAGRRGHTGIQPLNQHTPPGVAGRWARILGRTTAGYMQPVEVRVPGRGSVTFYQPGRGELKTTSAPGFARIAVGGVYRIRIHNMAKFPGVSLYPSIELIDRLHPPAGKADKFPIPIEFTTEEIQQAARGRMITKVVFLEQPQIAVPTAGPISTTTVPANRNLVQEADRRGRPMAIVRLGSRQPRGGAGGGDTGFFGPGSPIQFRE